MPASETEPPDDLLRDPLLRDAPVVEGFKVLDPAVLYARVGQGGMGSVYRGRHFKLDLDVAVKCLKPSLAAEDVDFVKRFEREARLAASIAHQNVVRVMDVQEKNGLHYLVMEFVRGETAAERVKRKGRLAEKEALAILYGTTCGLAEAHQRGIVHRDIKPDNVMISLEGRVKLADLGLAKSTSVGDGSVTAASASRVMGTPQYMPPEQWDSADVTSAADVWALGALLFYLLAGRPGIEGSTYQQVATNILSKEYPSLRTIRPDVRESVHELLERCVQRDPKLRFADARALLAALRRLVEVEDDMLADPGMGSESGRIGTVTPPPRQALMRIRAALELSQQTLSAGRSKDGASPAGGTRVIPDALLRERAPRLEPNASRFGPVAIAVAVAILFVLGVAYAAGWFTATDRGPSNPSIATAPRSAKEAMEAGLAALPRVDGLDEAIAHLEEALRQDPSLVVARKALVGALGKKVDGLAVSDPDAAFVVCRRGLEVDPADAHLTAAHAQLRSNLEVRLVAGMTIQVPAARSASPKRSIQMRGRVVSPGMKMVRLQGTSKDATIEARPLTVIAGEFATEVEVRSDGEWRLSIEGEDQHGLRAAVEPVVVVVDTVDPVLTVEAPPRFSYVGGTVVMRGRVADATPCKVTVADQPALVAASGEWTIEAVLRDGEQRVPVEATDASGRQARVEWLLQVDAVPPKLAVASVPAVTNASEVEISGSVTGLELGTLLVDGKKVGPTGDGKFAARVALPEDRIHKIVVEATDAKGNRSTHEVSVRRHTKAPVVEWTSPDLTQPVIEGEVRIEGSVLCDLAGVVVTVNGKAVTVQGTKWVTTVQLQTGKDLDVEVVATDAAGNRSQTLLRTFRSVLPSTERRATVVADVETGIGMKMVFVQPGSFRMGTEGNTSDEKAHTVLITRGYWIGETEVTQKQWRDLMGTEPWKGRRYTAIGDDYPATHLTWTNAVAFCEKLTERERAAARVPDGHRYQLPTEAEWEMACRGGSKAAFCSGDEELRIVQYAVFGQALDGGHPERVRGRRRPNAFGIYDMHGNVLEWCADSAEWASPNVVTDTYRGDTVDPLCAVGSLRVIRGGAWNTLAAECRSAVRDCNAQGFASYNLGFRPVLAVRSAAK